MRVQKILTTSFIPTLVAVVGLTTLAGFHSAHAAMSTPVSSQPAIGSSKTGSIPTLSTAKTMTKGESVQTEIGALEEKLYEHTYPKDADDARIGRIEKFVYGAAQTGTTAARVARLQSSLSAESSAIDKVQATNKVAASGSSSASKTDTQSASTPTDAVKSAPKFDSANYPRVTQLEKEMLNATYDHEPLDERLSRLETKAFGKVSKSDDLAERVDDLDEYAETHQIFKNRRNPLASSPIASTGNHGVFSNSYLSGRNFGATNSDFDASDEEQNPDVEEKKKAPVNPFINGVSGTDQRLSSIEEFVYGHNYAMRPAQDRLERLEKRLVPYEHNLAQKDVTYRVNNLWNILNVANTLNNAPTAAHPGNTQSVASVDSPARAGTPSASSSTLRAPSQSTLTQATTSHHSWLHQLGKSLGSADVSTNASNVPGIYPPDMGPKPGHLWVP